MAQDIFIRFTSIEGESQDFAHKGEIDVLRWTWAARQPSNMHSGSGGGAGKSTIGDLYFDHFIDKSSPSLLQYSLSGKPIPEAVLTVRKAGGSPLEYQIITLQEVIITRVALICYDNMPAPLEKVAIAFSRVKMDYVLQNAEGKTAGTVSMGYHIKANTMI